MSAIKSVKCPKCRKDAPLEGNPYRPFCSKRCKMVDLGVWASEGYRIPGERAPEEEEEENEE